VEKTYLRPLDVQKLTYREAAYTAIKAAVLAGELPFGSPLVEERLAALLQISRTPVREALAILEHEGIIGPGERRGLFIRAVEPERFAALYWASEVAQAHLARRAAVLGTEELLQVMEEALARLRYYAEADDLPRYLESGRVFWRRVGEAAENAPLSDFVQLTAERIDLYLLAHRQGIGVEALARSAEETAGLLEALVARDPDEAARLVTYAAQSLRRRLPGLFAAGEA
jgi:DNA-binding GntR family transcriptional regulator